MGTGGTSFQRLAYGIGALLAIQCASCRTSREGDDLHSQLQVSAGVSPPSSLASGHRFGRWLEVDPEPAARPALDSACLLEQTGASEEAIDLLGKALEDVRDCASLFEARGALYLSTGFPRAAAGDFQRAVALGPERPRGWFALGHAYEVLGLTRQSLEALEHAHALGGDALGLLLSLARVHRALGHPGRAACNYQRALRRMDAPVTEILVEATLLVAEDPARAEAVEKTRERLESCNGARLSDDAWLLRALVREIPGEPADKVGAMIRALEVAQDELGALAESTLTALRLVDAETREEARAELLAAETDGQRRALLERCLARP